MNKLLRVALAAGAALLISGQVAEASNAPKMVSLNRKLSLVSRIKELTTWSDDDFKCLALAIYHEAALESPADIMAVTDVIINRSTNDHFPPNICATVWQPHQFSWTAGSVSKILPRNNIAWTAIQNALIDRLAGDRHDVTKGALYFFDRHSHRPKWSYDRASTIKTNYHVFLADK